MIRLLLFSIFSLLSIFLIAQTYNNGSTNLPNIGTKQASMDVATADLDQDGDLDIVLANEFQPNTILINDGSGKFSNGTSGNLPQPIHDSEDVVIADFNMDGNLDLVFCSEDDIVHEYYWGDGSGSFSTAGSSLPNSTANAVITADFNNDSFPDLMFGNAGQNTLLINNGDGSFTNETSTRLPNNNNTTQDLQVADIDGDNDLDIFEGNENGNRLLLNDGSGIFSDVSSTQLPQGLNLETRKADFGDADGDGDLDLFLSNVRFIPGKNRQNRLWLNNGNGIFSDSTATHLPTHDEDTLDGIFEDVDQDGDMDLVIANVNLALPAPLRIYQNDGTGHFIDKSSEILPQQFFINALGVITGDFNGDGFSDLYFCDRNIGNSFKDILLFRENTNGIFKIPSVEQLTVFPNPAKEILTIQWNSKFGKIQHSQLVDISGKVLLEQIVFDEFSNNLLKMKIPELDAGQYFINIQTNKAMRVGKFFFEK